MDKFRIHRLLSDATMQLCLSGEFPASTGAPVLVRYPTISPDGSQVAFAYDDLADSLHWRRSGVVAHRTKMPCDSAQHCYGELRRGVVPMPLVLHVRGPMDNCKQPTDNDKSGADDRYWPRSIFVLYSYTAANQGNTDLSRDEKPEGNATPARSYEA